MGKSGVALALVASALVLQLDAAHAAPTARTRAVQALAGSGARLGMRGDVVTFAGGTAKRPLAPAGDGDAADAAREFVDDHAAAFGVDDPAGELVEEQVSDSASGEAVRFRQTVDGLPVLGGELVVSVGETGEVLAAAGEVSTVVDDSTGPAVPADAARALAIAVTARNDDVDVSTLTATIPERWWYDPALIGAVDPIGARVVWRVEVRTEMGDVDRLVLVDAATGAIALTFSQVAHAKSINVCDNQNIPWASTGCITPTPLPNPLRDPNEAVRANEYLHGIWDFFFANFGRDSFDGSGATTTAVVQFCPASGSCPYRNAFWNGSILVFGDNYAYSDDVVAHEFTHAVTQFEADLFYYAESGAINESISDVFGELYDIGNGAAPDERWKLGERDGSLAGVLRDMSDPPLHNDPDRMQSPLFFGGAGDDHGVHINSGVNNKAAYLLTDGGDFNNQSVVAIGAAKVARIYYEALTSLLTPGSDYLDLGRALPQACRNLIGGGFTAETDCLQVDRAVLATEMYLRPTTPGADLTAPVCDADRTFGSTLFTDDMENPSSARWTFAPSTGTRAWSYYTGSSQSGVRSLRGPDRSGEASTSAQLRNAIAIPAGATAYLRFDHSFSFEYDTSPTTYFDGGLVEYSTNAGATWNDAAELPGTINGYNATLDGNGDRAYSGTSPGYQETRIDVSGLAGSSVLFRFRVVTDQFAGADGWFVDDVSVYTCLAGPPPPPPTTAFVAAGPARVFDTRGESSNAIRSVTVAKVGGPSVLEVKVTDLPGLVPSTGVGAVALNVAVTNTAAAGFVSAYPCGPRPFVANVNHAAGETVSNGVIAPVSEAGSVCFYSLVAADLVVDITGWFPAATGYSAAGPARVFDTRGESANALRPVTVGKVGGGYVLEVQMTDLAGVVPVSGVGAVSLNVAVTGTSAAGYVSAYPCGARPLVASVNHAAGETVSNNVIAPLSPTGSVCFFSLVPADVVVDVNGWFAAGSAYTAAGPGRVFDTRGESPNAIRAVQVAKVGGGYVLEVPVTDLGGVVPASGVMAVSLNVASTGSSQAGFVTVYPCGARPFAASLNHAGGETVSNGVIAPVSATGTICFYSLVPADLVVDVNGWFRSS